MGVDLRRVQMLMAQDLLDGFDVHAVGDHQGRRRVPQLVGGILAWIQSGSQHMLFHKTVHGRHADAVIVPGAEQCAVVRKHFFVAFGQIGVDGSLAGSAEIDDPLLVALAGHTDAVLINVTQIQAHQL